MKSYFISAKVGVTSFLLFLGLFLLEPALAATNQTISFGALPDKTYGDPSFNLSASASSGLPITFYITYGPANVSGNLVSIAGAGTVTIRASQPGDADYDAATPVDHTFAVATAPLKVVVDYKSRLFGETNPVFTGTISGLLNGDNITATYGTQATTNSPVGNHTITATLVDPDNKAGNYKITGLTNSLSVNAAPIEWPVASGGNGHFYQPILAPNGIVWGAAEAAAEAKGGYLVTLTSSNENAFVFNLITNNLDYWNFALGPIELLGPWIGGIQPPGSPEPAGGWSWVTGEPFVYNNWLVGQPNDDVPGDQNRIQIFSLNGHPDSVWNDLHDTDYQLVSSYIIEYDTNPNKSNQTITFGSLTNQIYGHAPFDVSATASSGLPVTFSIVSGPATVASNTVTITGAGLVTVRASQASNPSFTAATNVDQSFTVNPAVLTVVAANATRAYGVANPALTGTLTGVVNADAITATYATAAATNSSVGTYAIISSLFDPNSRLVNYTVNSTNGTLTISQATPSITWADPANIVYGTALSGTQLNSSSAVAGTFTYTPDLGTTLLAGMNQILSVNFVPTDAQNYSNAAASVTLNVDKAPSITTVTSSSNPSPTGSNVTFTAMLASVGPAGGTPTGPVQFWAGGSALGGPVLATNGVAQLATAALAHGSHAISAAYAGDNNFIGSTNTLSPDHMINSAPVTHLLTLSANENTPVCFSIPGLLATVADTDQDPITLSSLDAAGINGGTVASNGNQCIIFTPLPNSTNADSFNYSVSDGFGGTASGTVSVTFNVAPNVAPFNLLNHGHATILFTGIPNRIYSVQVSTNLTDWSTIGSVPAGTNSQFQFEDVDAPNFPNRYYRAAYP
ncbi:MAG: hypothetical protein JWR19_2055 [Pedosphaera sp.]|nr:hypothetical protein [Pedosphaera sp.]